MAATTTSVAAKYQNVELVPWDPTDDCQFQRMHDQRVMCGWHEDEVPEWKDKMLKGQKLLYWIVSWWMTSVPDGHLYDSAGYVRPRSLMLLGFIRVITKEGEISSTPHRAMSKGKSKRTLGRLSKPSFTCLLCTLASLVDGVQESNPLRDTASVSFDAERKPTGLVFHPIGHIALESIPDRNATFSLPASTLWIRSLYISW